MVSNNVNDIYKIKDLITLGKENSLNLELTNIFAKNTNCEIIYPIHNILRDSYRQIILRYCSKLELDDEDMIRYKYNPKKLSYDIYGGVELWHLLLWINNMTSVSQFNRKNILVFNPAYIHILSRIIDLEEENLYKNKHNPIENLQ